MLRWLAGECSCTRGKPCPLAHPTSASATAMTLQGFDMPAPPRIFSRFALPDERRLQLKDDVTWSHGKHTTKFGLDYNKVSDFINNLYNGYGTYDFDWAYSFIGDYLHATTGLGGTGYAGGGTPTAATTTTVSTPASRRATPFPSNFDPAGRQHREPPTAHASAHRDARVRRLRHRRLAHHAETDPYARRAL